MKEQRVGRNFAQVMQNSRKEKVPLFMTMTTMTTMTIRYVLVMCSVVLLACTTPGGGKPDTHYMFPPQPAFDQAAAAWFAHDTDAYNTHMEDVDISAGVALGFLSAEAAFWKGDVERAFTLYLSILSTDPGHPVSRFSAMRLLELDGDIINYADRLQPVLSTITYNKVHPLTAVQLAQIGERISWHTWNLGKEPVPFSGDSVGLATRWMTTPTLSKWRLLDFEHKFLPETQNHLQGTYLSTYIAQDVSQNRQEPRAYISSSYNLAPRFPSSGIHYLETFANVTASKEQTYLLYADFPSSARVFIDGVEVMERLEGDYGSGKRMRRIKLAPGVHRVLIKMAYQRGYRDWFDLSFLNTHATAWTGSKIMFSEKKPAQLASKKVTLLSKVWMPMMVEPVAFNAMELEKNSSLALYLQALAAYCNRDAWAFTRAHKVLKKRHPKFAPAFGLKAAQVQTLWEVPAELRDDTTLKALRAARTLDPESLYYLIHLGHILRSKDQQSEVRTLLEDAKNLAVSKDGVLKNMTPLSSWAAYLESQGWDEAAEKAWVYLLKLAPNHCGAAERLQMILHGRQEYPDPKEYFGSAVTSCPELERTWVEAQPESEKARLAWRTLDLKRAPHLESSYLNKAVAEEHLGQQDAALATLKQGIALLPSSTGLIIAMAKRVLATGNRLETIKLLELASSKGVRTFDLVWRIAELQGKLPMMDLLQDGVAVAKEIVAKDLAAKVEGQSMTGTADEAFYAIDFAARAYHLDGTSTMLTHTMVRVMTKGAIDRFAEVTVPPGARILKVRTIKKDGTVRVPERTAGKSVLSMPGLAEGDFVELAYMEFEGANSMSKTHKLGTKFYFRMQDISSYRSEYVVINPLGPFMMGNNPPKAKKFVYHGKPAVRFLQKNSPRPRAEPGTPGVEEYLPWVQMSHNGVTVDLFEVMRRTVHEQIKDSSKRSELVDRQLNAWLEQARELSGEAKVRALFSMVSAYFPSASGGWNTDISHALITKRGNPMAVLHLLLQHAKIESHLFFIRSKFAPPWEHVSHEYARYSTPILRVKVPGSKRYVWLNPSSPDAMFEAMSADLIDQPAVCITCKDMVKVKVTDTDKSFRRHAQDVRIVATLDDQGTLLGSVEQVFDGGVAVYVRSVLRARVEETARQKFMEAVVARHISGASVTGFKIIGQDKPHDKLVLKIQIVRPQLARMQNGVMVLQLHLFKEAVASRYATLPQRTLPLLVSSAQKSSASLDLTLPLGKTPNIRTQSGTWALNNTVYGTFERSVTLKGRLLQVRSLFEMDVQRIPVTTRHAPFQRAHYKTFQEWAVGVEQSSLLVVTM